MALYRSLMFMAAMLLLAIAGMTTLLPAPGVSLAAQGAPEAIHTRHAIMIDKKKAGTVSTARERPVPGMPSELQVDSQSQIEVAGTWGTWEMASRDSYLFDGADLVSYSLRISEDGTPYSLAGRMRGEQLYVDVREGDGASKEYQVPAEAFDGVVEGIAHFFHARGYAFDNTAVRLLEASTLEIRKMDLTAQGSERVEACGREFDCRKVEAVSDDARATYWIAHDGLGPFIVKEEGDGKDGPYSMVLEHYDG